MGLLRLLPITVVLLLFALPAAAQWAAQPGASMRNAFGPQAGSKANQCRGACGAGCPASCDRQVSFECADSARLRRVVTYQCGTHQGCRVHDDCLDACIQSGTGDQTCQSRCDSDVVERFGFESAGSWLTGGGPYDGEIDFEYTRDGPDALEPAYRCPDGAARQCGETATCIAANGRPVDPVFDAYPGAGAGAMQISGFRSGPVCGDGVCEHANVISVTGADSCAGGSCTRFGMEFDYRNADPSVPLECSVSTSGGSGDFIGDLLKQGADAMESRGGGTAAGQNKDDGMAQLLGVFQQVLTSADSPEDVEVSMAPLDENGNPIESQRVGSTPRGGASPIPRNVDLPAASGHLFVPMYQLASSMHAGETRERRVRCTHRGAPVLETVFVLEPAG